MMDDRFYIVERDSWFKGHYTHAVQDRKLSCRICISNEWSCQLIADLLNSSVTGKPLDGTDK